MKKKIAIIGAGPAGLAAAYQLVKNTFNEVVMFEASDMPGGMCKSIKLWDCTVDIGPHRFFSYDTRVNKLWLEVVGKDYKMVNRLTRIFYENKFFYYPIQAFDALKKVGIFTAVQCFFSYVKQKISPIKSDASFETWVTSRFGKKLYSIFFKTYSEKLWGVKCTDLDDDFASQRIKKLSLSEVLLNALKLKRNKHKTLADKFAYPIEGTGMVYQRMADFIESRNGKIHYNTPVQKVVVENGRATGLVLQTSNHVELFDEIISTMPFTDLIAQIPDLPVGIKHLSGKLKYRNTVMVYLKVEGIDLFDDNWLYIHSADLQVGRVTNFRNWIPELYGINEITILALEYWCYDDDDLWQYSDEECFRLAKTEIQKTGLIKYKSVSEGFIYKIHRAYPTYHKGYKNDLNPLEEYVRTIVNLQCIGRYGAFKYNNQDHSLLMGILAAENINELAGHNLWKVNTDYDSYQENSLITETGLEKSNG
ncbi:MAG: FAD-dependent oxidoreductase [Dysgonamonadaceae bacterium]|jgi:protoporphyrinogen oxidase|nr:FAD-dependent oxidoreductase [Dysgonamonadaceae bacterium]